MGTVYTREVRPTPEELGRTFQPRTLRSAQGGLLESTSRRSCAPTQRKT